MYDFISFIIYSIILIFLIHYIYEKIKYSINYCINYSPYDNYQYIVPNSENTNTNNENNIDKYN